MAGFFRDRIFSPQRTAHLAAQLPATDTDAAARRDTRAAALTVTTPKAADPAILDEIPYAGDILPQLPPALKARLFAMFDVAIVWNKPGSQVTVHAEITDETLRALPALLNPGQDGYHDTHDPDIPPGIGHLTQPRRAGRSRNRQGGSVGRSVRDGDRRRVLVPAGYQ